MIPHVIHFIWLGSELPGWCADNIDSFREFNPDHLIRIHTTHEMLLPRFRDAWNRSETLAQQSDVLRYSVLQQEPGWYFDTDCICYRPLDELAKKYRPGGRLFFVRYKPSLKHVNNAILAAQPCCTAWARLNPLVIAADPSEHTSCYGPVLFRQIVREHPDVCCIGEPEDFGEPHAWGTPPPAQWKGGEPFVYHVGVNLGNSRRIQKGVYHEGHEGHEGTQRREEEA